MTLDELKAKPLGKVGTRVDLKEALGENVMASRIPWQTEINLLYFIDDEVFSNPPTPGSVYKTEQDGDIHTFLLIGDGEGYLISI